MIINQYINNSSLLNGGFCDVEMQVGVCVCVCVWGGGCVCRGGGGGVGWFRASVILVGFLCDSYLVL